MRRWLDIGFSVLIAMHFMSTGSSSQPVRGASQNPSTPKLIPNTTLRVAIPGDWRLETGQRGSPQLKHARRPEYAITVSQSTAQTKGHSCMDLVGSMQSISALGGTVLKRPAFIPDVYFGSDFKVPKSHLTCMSVGRGLISVMVQLTRGDPKPEVLTTMLAAIADAGIKQSGAVSAPGSLKLPLLGIEVPVRSGAWGVGNVVDTWGTNDLLGRVAYPNGNEVHVTPFLFKLPGRCESLMVGPQFSSAGRKVAKGRGYGGPRWHPDAV